jgi:hypothetical protein
MDYSRLPMEYSVEQLRRVGSICDCGQLTKILLCVLISP